MIGGTAEWTTQQGPVTTVGELSDGELLAQFLDAEEVASQEAFQALVGRHGPRVLRICRHVLKREHDAEDAFQATFLTLARNGASIRDGCALAGWLREVACRTALKSRARQNRRQAVERQVMDARPRRDEQDDQGERASVAELKPLLHEEVTGLPDKYRIPVVLSYLEGKTNEEVARILNWPVGTVKGRLSRGRALLRSRLTRRGIALSTAMLLLALSRSRADAAMVPEALVRRTLRRAFATGIASKAGASSGPGTSPAALQPQAPAAPTGEPSPLQAPSPSSRLAEGEPEPWTPGRMIAGWLALLIFGAAVFVGGFLSSAAYAGKLPDLRSAFSILMPSSHSGGSCH